eukprot:TRINITY_DN7023_c0_g1_i6.p1 TRINITY_DN7023_c0_g1~~TRINITY_DN7023_c0_g1_i6.p1  ORF type:complete len:1599 (+),score=426.32 TRINITY_DN7023_c0_g1_i6:222-4799(+)
MCEEAAGFALSACETYLAVKSKTNEHKIYHLSNLESPFFRFDIPFEIMKWKKSEPKLLVLQGAALLTIDPTNPEKISEPNLGTPSPIIDFDTDDEGSLYLLTKEGIICAYPSLRRTLIKLPNNIHLSLTWLEKDLMGVVMFNKEDEVLYLGLLDKQQEGERKGYLLNLRGYENDPDSLIVFPAYLKEWKLLVTTVNYDSRALYFARVDGEWKELEVDSGCGVSLDTNVHGAAIDYSTKIRLDRKDSEKEAKTFPGLIFLCEKGVDTYQLQNEQDPPLDFMVNPVDPKTLPLPKRKQPEIKQDVPPKNTQPTLRQSNKEQKPLMGTNLPTAKPPNLMSSSQFKVPTETAKMAIPEVISAEILEQDFLPKNTQPTLRQSNKEQKPLVGKNLPPAAKQPASQGFYSTAPISIEALGMDRMDEITPDVTNPLEPHIKIMEDIDELSMETTKLLESIDKNSYSTNIEQSIKKYNMIKKTFERHQKAFESLTESRYSILEFKDDAHYKLNGVVEKISSLENHIQLLSQIMTNMCKTYYSQERKMKDLHKRAINSHQNKFTNKGEVSKSVAPVEVPASPSTSVHHKLLKIRSVLEAHRSRLDITKIREENKKKSELQQAATIAKREPPKKFQAQKPVPQPQPSSQAPQPQQNTFFSQPQQNLAPQPQQKLAPQPQQNLAPQPQQKLAPQPQQNLAPQPQQNTFFSQPQQNLAPQPQQNTFFSQPKQNLVPQFQPSAKGFMNPSASFGSTDIKTTAPSLPKPNDKKLNIPDPVFKVPAGIPKGPTAEPAEIGLKTKSLLFKTPSDSGSDVEYDGDENSSESNESPTTKRIAKSSKVNPIQSTISKKAPVPSITVPNTKAPSAGTSTIFGESQFGFSFNAINPQTLAPSVPTVAPSRSSGSGSGSGSMSITESTGTNARPSAQSKQSGTGPSTPRSQNQKPPVISQGSTTVPTQTTGANTTTQTNQPAISSSAQSTSSAAPTTQSTSTQGFFVPPSFGSTQTTSALPTAPSTTSTTQTTGPTNQAAPSVSTDTGTGQTAQTTTGPTAQAPSVLANNPTVASIAAQTTTAQSSAPAPTTGLFGNANQGSGLFGDTSQASGGSTGLFGNTNQGASSGVGGSTGLFGATNQSGGLFGSNTQGTGLFGTNQASSSGGTGLFGSNQGSSSGGTGLFGTNQGSSSGGTGLFGNTNQGSGGSGSGLFGNTTNQSGGLFGSSTPGGAFGSSTPGGAFGSGTPGGAFGSSTPGGAFGSGTPGGAFGSSTPGGAFGSGTPGGAFGSSTPGGAFGSGTPGGAFGSSTPGGAFGSSTPGTGLFGSNQGSSSGGTGLFGTNQGSSSGGGAFGSSGGAFGSSGGAFGSSGGAFGSSTPGGAFGSSTPGGAFGSSTPGGAFGSSAPGGAFGSSASGGAFGSSNQGSGFGGGGGLWSGPPVGFGSATNTQNTALFGSAPPSGGGSLFGSQNTAFTNLSSAFTVNQPTFGSPTPLAGNAPGFSGVTGLAPGSGFASFANKPAAGSFAAFAQQPSSSAATFATLKFEGEPRK